MGLSSSQFELFGIDESLPAPRREWPGSAAGCRRSQSLAPKPMVADDGADTEDFVRAMDKALLLATLIVEGSIRQSHSHLALMSAQ